MDDLGERDGNEGRGSTSELWRRAPAWRWTVILAALASVITACLWLGDHEIAAETPATDATRPSASDLQKTRSTLADAPNLAAAPPAPAPVSVTEPGSAVSGEEEQREARCHPGLLGAPIVMPQVNVAGMPDPEIGHMKVHMWINGAGVVVRDALTASSYGTPEEQQAELAYTSRLMFAVPQKAECASREIELIGDFFQHRNGAGRWRTYIRVYPRFYFNPPGVLVQRD
jgi:hypothetical protein